MNCPSPENQYQIDHVTLLCDSYRRWTGRELIDSRPEPVGMAEALFMAPFAVVSHGIESDPLFNYANHTALTLFELDWEVFIQLPSRQSAEPVNRADRARLLAQVSEQGYCDDYAGVRISSSGRRFQIEQATVWNLQDSAGRLLGQAAMFADWCYL